MKCRKCRKEALEKAVYCPWCGAKLVIEYKGRTRPNGTGTAYKRGSVWEARVVVGWKADEEKDTLRPIMRTKSGFKTKREALEYCAVLKTCALPTKKQSVSRAKDNTFKALFDAFVARLESRGRTAGTISGYKAAFAHFAPLHHIEIKIIGADDLQDCVDECPKGKRTKETMKSVAGLTFKYAMERNIIEKNYAAFIFTGNGEKGTHPPFTALELEQIRQAVGIVPYADYIYFMCLTGYRPAEQLTRTKADYDADNNCIWGGIKTDAGKTRAVTISPKVQSILDSRLRVLGEYLFPRQDTGLPMTTDYFHKYCFKPCMEALGITGRVPYSCRHTFANLMKNTQGSDTDKAALMGHTDASMTKYYQSADLDSLRKITDAI